MNTDGIDFDKDYEEFKMRSWPRDVKVRIYCDSKNYKIAFLLSYKKYWKKWEDEERIETFGWYVVDFDHFNDILSEARAKFHYSSITEDNPLRLRISSEAYSAIIGVGSISDLRERTEASRVEVYHNHIYLIIDDEGIFYRDRIFSHAYERTDLSDHCEEICSFFANLKLTLFDNPDMDFTTIASKYGINLSLYGAYLSSQREDRSYEFPRPKDAISYYTMKIRYLYETFLKLRDGPDFIDEIFADGFLLNKKGIKIASDLSDWTAKFNKSDFYKKSDYIITNEQQCNEIIEKITDFVNSCTK